MAIICHKWLIVAIACANFFEEGCGVPPYEKNNLKRFPLPNHSLYRRVDFSFFRFGRVEAVLDYETRLKRSKVEGLPEAFAEDRCGKSIPDDD